MRVIVARATRANMINDRPPGANIQTEEVGDEKQ